MSGHSFSGPAALMRELAAAWNGRDPSLLDRICTESCVLHFRGTSTRMRSPEGKAIVAKWAAAFPDNRFTIEDVVAEGSRGAIRLTLRGTHEGPFFDWPATGRVVEVTEMMFGRVENGRIAELWEDFDFMGLWEQLGRPLERPG